MLEIKDLHKPFSDYLRKQGIPYSRARSDKSSTIEKGHPDFSIFLGGRVLFIEFKTLKGKTSSDQDRRIDELVKAGCTVHVIRDISRAIEVVEAWRTMVFHPNEDVQNLVVMGNGVFRKTGASYDAVRPATPRDHMTLPKA